MVFRAVKPVLVLATAIIVSACQLRSGAPESPAAAGEPREGGAFLRCYRLEPAASELRLLVYRDGPLARVGHNHVMVSRALEGALALVEPLAATRLQVRLPAATLEIDPPALRAEEGEAFAAEVSDEARSGTRENMLGPRVLDAETYPFVDVFLESLRGPLWSADATLRIRLRDREQVKLVPVTLRETATAIEASSSFSITHAELGLSPFSVLGGGLRVGEEVRIRARLSFAAAADVTDPETCLAGLD